MTENNHKNNNGIPNAMPEAMIQPITDMEIIIAKLKRAGELNKNAEDRNFYNTDKEV